jgi:hypothetical protein
MRNLFLKAGVLMTTVALAATSAIAQSTVPTTAVGLAQAIDLSDAKSAGLVVVGVLVAVGVTLWGARLVLSKFQPKL